MCTVVILKRPGHAWPILIGANRDELQSRPWQKPEAHWPDRPDTIAGLDVLAGGSWLGMNKDGIVAAILNRPYTLGPLEGYRSRGELPLEALDHAEASDAVEALADLNPQAYRPFNMVIADGNDSYWLKNDGETIKSFALPDGLSMLTAHDLNSKDSSRIRTHLDRFRLAPVPDPDNNDFMVWEALLASEKTEGHWRGAMCVEGPDGFGTVCSSLIALPNPKNFRQKPIWKFCAGRPGQATFEDVDLSS